MEIKIRSEESKDIDAVREIVRAAFPTPAESKLVDALRENGKATISLVAVNADEVLGHILFSPVAMIPRDGTPPPDDVREIGLAPVAVRPDVQSKGIGSQLIRAGLLHCKEMGYDYCVVLGNPDYYHRFGFERASSYGIENEYGVDEEFMWMRFSNPKISGPAKYAAEFGLFFV